jgi:glycosyltransferase involved in cell wall biosynthesis
MPNKVSAIIPTFNRAHLLEQAIESVCIQTVKDIEIIVVDDGSSDGTSDMVKRFSDRVQFFRQEHGGLNMARNFGLRQARGDFIALLDDDDLWLPFKTELQLSVLKRFPELAYVFSDFIIFNESGIKTSQGLATWHKFPKPWEQLMEQHHSAKKLSLMLPPETDDYHIHIGRLYHELLYEPYVLPSTTLVRRSAIRSDDPFPENNTHCGDWQFFADLSRHSSCGFMSLATASNRSHDDAVRLTRKSARVQTRDRLSMIEQLWKADDVFMTNHASDVFRVESDQLLRMVRSCLLEHGRPEAIDYLRRWRQLSPKSFYLKGWLLHIPAYISFSTHLLIALRKIKEWIFNRSIT